MEIRYALPNDLDGLLDLLKANHVNTIPANLSTHVFPKMYRH